MHNIPRQTNRIPGVNLGSCMKKWKDYGLEKLIKEEQRLQEVYFTMRNNPALENQVRLILEQLQRYIQARYQKEDKKNQKKINL